MKMTTPNKLTILRILMVPLIVIVPYISALDKALFTLVDDVTIGQIITLALFILASLTDMLDGYLARKNNQITDFGKLMDPLADKILVIATMIVLMQMGRMYGFVIIIIAFREFLITGIRQLAAASGDVIAASKLGKSKTISQIITICYLLIFKPGFSNVTGIIGIVLISVATALTLLSGIDYLVKNKKVIKSM